jgi:flagellar assembly factor FliW
MEVQTRDFGTVVLEELKTIKFVEPIFGFEEYDEFVLLSESEFGEGILWLQSLEEPDLCFIITDPRLTYPDYHPELTPGVKEKLSSKGIKDPVFWTIAVLREEFANSTINLKSPVLIDSETRYAAQVILEEDYPIRAPLMPQEGGAQDAGLDKEKR